MIVRQMLRRIRVLDVGDTNFLIDEQVEKHGFEEENERVLGKGGFSIHAATAVPAHNRIGLESSLDGKMVSVQQTGAGEITAEIPAGMHSFSLSSLALADASGDWHRDAGPEARVPTLDSEQVPGAPSGCGCRVADRADAPRDAILALLAMLVLRRGRSHRR